jgi:hypothetical protein
MGRWTRTPGKPSEETYECTMDGTKVVQTTPDMTEAAKQLRHVNEQLAIAGAYPGRERAQPRGKVFETGSRFCTLLMRFA